MYCSNEVKVVIVGVGYVGLVSGVCFSEFGFDVTCVDNISSKIDLLNSGGVPIYEPGLSNLLKKNRDAGRLHFTTSIEQAVSDADVIIIAVGTPSREDGSADLRYVFGVAEEISTCIRDSAVLVVKSTVPVGTTSEVQKILRLKGKKSAVAFNPEFLREGAAVSDFMRPDRVILGVRDENAKKLLTQLYRPLYTFNIPIVFMDLESAELCKYASNAFLAMKVAFINEIANLCECCNADVNDVALAMGLDNRIGGKFLQAGPGYGGSCFPKDTSALYDFSKNVYGIELSLVRETINSNNRRKISMVEKIIKFCGGSVAEKTLAVLGVTFKPDTDDMRDSPSLDIIPHLIQHGANIRVYDPSNSSDGKKMLKGVKWASDVVSACENADAVVILTDWNEFKALNVEYICNVMRRKVVIDLRNIFIPREVREHGIEYYSIGRN